MNKDINRNKLENLLDEIMDNFDFEKVAKVMETLNWTWLGADTSPTVEELQNMAGNLLWDVCNADYDVVSAGGFEASKDFSDPDDPYVALRFVVEEWDAGEKLAENDPSAVN